MSTQPMRLFFALPCPADLAARIVDWRAQLGSNGKPVIADNLHLTLAFLGMQPAENLAQIMLLADGIESPAFTVAFDQLNLWPDGLLHLAPSRPPDALLSLARKLHSGLQSIGVEPEQREYLPHLTLARHYQGLIPASSPMFCLEARRFSLFASESRSSGVHYRELATWTLKAAPANQC